MRPSRTGGEGPAAGFGSGKHSTLSRIFGGLSAVLLLALASCSQVTIEQLQRVGLPESSTDRAQATGGLWVGTWIAAAVIGIGVWGLIGWVVVRYRRKDATLPRQNRYNLPLEVLYTVAPFVIIGVLFYFTLIAQHKVIEPIDNPDHTVSVVGQKWSWSFNYDSANNPAVGQDVYEFGTINQSPDLYLPVNKSVKFSLTSPDVIHSFWIPSFYEKLDVIPGRVNTMYVTPTKEGIFPGKCAELCGTYHSAMIFNVHIVSQEEFDTYLKTLAAKGNVGKLTGPKDANPQGAPK